MVPKSLDVLDTLELRWFARLDRGPDSLPAGVGDVDQKMTDRYAPTGPACGIKLRARQLDVKRRRPYADELEQPGTGHRYQAWRKHSLPLPAQRDVISKEWVTVDKHRHLTFRDARGVHIQVERATLKARGTSWWTVAVELSGELASAGDHLVLSQVGQLLQLFDGELDHAFFGSYPAWIETQVKQGKRT